MRKTDNSNDARPTKRGHDHSNKTQPYFTAIKSFKSQANYYVIMLNKPKIEI